MKKSIAPSVHYCLSHGEIRTLELLAREYGRSAAELEIQVLDWQWGTIPIRADTAFVRDEIGRQMLRLNDGLLHFRDGSPLPLAARQSAKANLEHRRLPGGKSGNEWFPALGSAYLDIDRTEVEAISLALVDRYFIERSWTISDAVAHVSKLTIAAGYIPKSGRQKSGVDRLKRLRVQLKKRRSAFVADGIADPLYGRYQMAMRFRYNIASGDGSIAVLEHVLQTICERHRMY